MDIQIEKNSTKNSTDLRQKYSCTINSKINGTPKGVYLPISKIHSILTVDNLLAHIMT